MAGRTIEKAGIWTVVSFAEGEKMAKLSADYVGAVNMYRANPNPDTRAAVAAADKVFSDAWTPIFERMPKESTKKK